MFETQISTQPVFSAGNLPILVLTAVLVGCPKLDDGEFYVAKLSAMIRQAAIRSITVLHMEVPCCTGLVRIAEAAIRQAQVAIPLHDTVVSISGKLTERPRRPQGQETGTLTPAGHLQLPVL